MATLAERVEPVAAGGHVVGLAWLGDALAVASGDGTVALGGRSIPVHPDGAVLVASADARGIVTGGDDGRVVLTDASGTVTELGHEKGRWIDAVALGPGGTAAWSAGKRVVARDAKGRLASWEAPSTARGLAFMPKGYRLAIAQYNGASLWFPGTEAKPEMLEWKGSHLDVTVSPDGRFVITSMQENSLHGWRLQPDRGHMRMSGYAAKPRSLAWSHDGKWLATSGADAVIVWPFDSKEGPMGKKPREMGVRPAKVTRCAFHPGSLVVAAGYEDGCILLIRMTDGSELLMRPASRSGPVTALAWDRTGARIAFGTAGGEAGRLTLPV